jgi:ABC-type glycerol-3-phosphate transport system substrate-binding protein
MRKTVFKKSAALVLAATMMISMAGCGKSNKDSSDTNTKNTKDMVYSGEELVFEGIQGDVSTVTVQGDKVYIETYEWISDEDATVETADTEVDEDAAGETTDTEADEDASEEETTAEEVTEDTSEEQTAEEDTEEAEESETSDDVEVTDVEGTSVTRFYCANADGTDLTEITLPETSDDEWKNNVFANEDGSYTYVYSSYDSKTDNTTYSVIKADDKGNISSKEDVTDILGLTNDNYISKTIMDDEENLIFALESSVKVLDKDLKLVCDLDSEDNTWLEGAAKTKDGQIVVGSSGEKAQVQVVDIENQKWGEKQELDISYFTSGDALMNGMGDYDFYYKDDSGVYGYDLTAKKSTQIMDYLASNIDSNNAYNMVPFTDGKFLCSYWDDENSKVYVYSKVDASTIKDKTTITVATNYIDDEIKKAAMEFNQNHDEYQIEFKDYSNEEDPTTKMNADMIAGNVADIICLNDLPVEQYVSKGLLEDLTPYFEKDEELSTDDIIDSLREAMEIDGKLYYVDSQFSVSTLMASSKDVGNEMGWTFDDLKELLDEKGDDVRPLYSTSKENMLYTFAGNATIDYVNWSTGECNFDSQDFKDILEICNRGTDEEAGYEEDSESMPTLLQSGKVLFCEGSFGLDEMQMYSKMFNDNLVFIGYPAEDKQGSYFSLYNNLGIYSKSEVKDAAWEFIRTFMTKEYQGKQVSTGNMWNIPSRKDAYDLKVQIAMATETFTDEYGTEHEPVDSSWGWDDLEVQIGPSSQADVDAYTELIDSTTKIGGYNQSIMDIIVEESKSYFTGDKTVDEVADVIQNRVKTYVNENR